MKNKKTAIEIMVLLAIMLIIIICDCIITQEAINECVRLENEKIVCIERVG